VPTDGVTVTTTGTAVTVTVGPSAVETGGVIRGVWTYEDGASSPFPFADCVIVMKDVCVNIPVGTKEKTEVDKSDVETTSGAEEGGGGREGGA
jgi:hypothetical protein